MTDTDAQGYLDLADWRRRVGDLYRIDGPDALERFRRGRDTLFRHHPESPIEPDEIASFNGLRFSGRLIVTQVMPALAPVSRSTLTVS